MAGTAVSIVTENLLWDDAASVAIGVLLAGVAVVLARESKQLLVGERRPRGCRRAQGDSWRASPSPTYS